MKGIVFNLLESCVSAEHGEDTWDDMLEAASLEGAYTSLGSYDDLEAFALIAAASKLLNVPAEEVERWFGRAAMGLLSERYPEFFAPHSATCSFVLTLNEIIHPEVRKLYPGADVPDFEFDGQTAGRFSMRYRSKRQMCAFAEGLIAGAADRYGERAEIEHPSCMKRGDEACTLLCSFTSSDLNG